MTSTKSIEQLIPSYRILVNGSELPSEIRSDIFSVSVLQDVEAAGMFALQMVTWDMNRLEMTWVDDERFAEGNEVSVEMGYANDLEELICGDITGLEPEFRTDDTPQLLIRGYDRRYRLMRAMKTRSFTQIKDSDIATQLASDAGLSISADTTDVTNEYVLQHNQTDLQFLRYRARRIGYEVVIDGNELQFRKRKNDQSEALTLNRAADLLEFTPRLAALSQIDHLTVRGWDLKQKSEIVAQAGSGDETTLMDGTQSGPQAAKDAFGTAEASVVDMPVFSQAEADEIAISRYNETAFSYITGEGKTVGRTDIQAGTVIRIEGVGERFSGLYYVTSARHSYTPQQGYLTSFSVRRNAT